MKGITLEELLREICIKYDIKEEELKSKTKRKQIVEARREYCYKAVEEHKYTGVAVSKLLGIDASAVSWAVKKYLESKYR